MQLLICFCIYVSFFCFFICSDSNLNRYEVHPTRTVSEAIGPEFYTHLRVRLWPTCSFYKLCVVGKLPVNNLSHHHSTKQDEAELEHFVVCSCRTSAVILWVIWSSGCICPLWLQKIESLWPSLMSFHTTWVALPRVPLSRLDHVWHI